ncbi:MAG TPA: hypothetical protein VGE97_06190, partial [Nitrososphaera sp.]
LMGTIIATYIHTFIYSLDSAAAQKSVHYGYDHPNIPNKTKITSVSILNSSSSNPKNGTQPTLLGNVTVANLRKVNIATPRYSESIPAPVSKNETESRYINTTKLLTKNPVDSLVTTLNVTNSSAIPHTNITNSSSLVHGGSDHVMTTPNATSINTKMIQHQIPGLNSLVSGGPPPPDTQIAVGPRHIAEFVNLQGQIWFKKGLAAKDFPLAQFFSTGADFISDPRIIYDNTSATWFASILDRMTHSVKLAVSTTDDPLGNWNLYDFPFTYCPDEPMIATSNDKFVISANDVQNLCLGRSMGAQYVIVDKNDLITGFDKPRFFQSYANMSQYSLLPVKMSDSSESSNITLATDGNQGSHYVNLYIISGKVPFLKPIQLVSLPVRTMVDPENVKGRQPVTGATINVGDARMIDGAMFRGKIWLGSNVGCVPKGDNIERSCIRLIQINATNNKVIQDFDFSLPQIYFYYPALSIDSAGNLNVMFGVSSDWMFPSLYITGQKAGSAPNYLNQAVNFTIGGSLIVGSRYGDYFGLSQDPANPNSFWVAGEYNTPHISFPGKDDWATVLGNFTYVP